MKKSSNALPVFLFTLALLAGCGYTTKTLLPEHIRSVNVEPTVNAINLSSEASDQSHFRVYRPGLEVDVTNAIQNRYIFDGHLKVAGADKADAILKTKLIDFRRDPVRYTDGDEVAEYRLNVTVDAAFYDARTHKVVWRQASLTGDSTYFLSGPLSVSEDEAVAKAVEDLARRVVEHTVEVW